jgi:hypothetical protein
MKWIKQNLTLSLVLSLVLALCAAGAVLVRAQVHAEDAQKHLTREVLQREYVPRTELDYRLDDMQQEQKQIRDGVERIESILLNEQ